MLDCTLDVKRSNSGFTLVELMITLSVAAILATVGVPSFMSTVASNRVIAASNEVVTVLNVAKSEAIRRGQDMVLCKSANGTGCGGNWSDGWILFNDTDSDHVKDADEQIIQVHGPLEASLGFVFKTADYIKFSPNGHSNENGHFCLRNSYKDTNSRAVIITQVGRIRTEVRTGTGDCIA